MSAQPERLPYIDSLLVAASAPAAAGVAAPLDVKGKDVAWAGLEDESEDSPNASSSGGIPGDAASALSAVAAAVLVEEKQKQPPQPVVQQTVRLTVAPGATLELPVSFSPQVLRQATAQVSVAILPELMQPATSVSEETAEQEAPRPRLGALSRWGPSSAAAALAPAAAVNPLVWKYDITGVARADAPGVKFAVKCVAKQKAEQVLQVPLPGLDVEQAAAAAAAAKAQAGSAAATPGVSGSLGGFRYSLLLPEEHRAALVAAVSLEALDAVPVPAASPTVKPGSGSSSAAVAGASVLRYLLHFAPQKALNAVAQLQVECGEGGACWLYDVTLSVSLQLFSSGLAEHTSAVLNIRVPTPGQGSSAHVAHASQQFMLSKLAHELNGVCRHRQRTQL
jgi:hypothetical protein